MKNSVKYYGSMVRVGVTKTTDDEITVHLEDVSAIPIEWIENWLKTCIPRYDNDRMTYIADVYEMLEEWEKENEQSSIDN